MPRLPRKIADAARDGEVQELRRWLEDGGDPNSTYMEATPLDHLMLTKRESHRNTLAAMRVLLEHGANPNRRNRVMDCLPIFLAKNTDALGVLLDAGANIDAGANFAGKKNGSNLLMRCVARHQLSTARYLVRRGADVNFLAAPRAWSNRPGRDDAEALSRRMFPNSHEMRAFSNLLARVKASGGFQPYVKHPRVELVRLRSLCARGRAAPPAQDVVLQHLFSGTRSPPLPNGVFWLILSYWSSSRDDKAHYRDGRCRHQRLASQVLMRGHSQIRFRSLWSTAFRAALPSAEDRRS